MDGHASVVGDGPRHGRYAHDDACRRVVTHDGVRGVATLPSATKDEDLPVAHRHAAALLRDRGHGLNRPPEDNTEQAAHFHSPACWRCGQRVSSSPVMGRSRRGTWWDRHTRRSGYWGTQLWCSAWRWGCWLVAATCLSLDRSTEPVTESETVNWRLSLLVGLDRPHTLPCNCCLGRRKHLPSTNKELYFDVTDPASWLQMAPRRKTEHLVNQELWSWHKMCAVTLNKKGEV